MHVCKYVCVFRQLLFCVNTNCDSVCVWVCVSMCMCVFSICVVVHICNNFLINISNIRICEVSGNQCVCVCVCMCMCVVSLCSDAHL